MATKGEPSLVLSSYLNPAGLAHAADPVSLQKTPAGARRATLGWSRNCLQAF